MAGEESIGAPDYVRESDLLGDALSVAAAAHRGQTRRDGSPYLAHPLRVCELLAGAGASEAALAAALLHDAVEGSELTVGEVVERFGVEIGELVGALTEDESIEPWVQRKEALRAQVAAAGKAAAAIYAADKLANIGEMRDLYAERGEAAIELHNAPSLDLRIDAWREDVEMIVRVAPGLALADGLRAGIAAFEAERSAAAERV
ncbi:MAG: HD domain-containing protein [Solirubrobacterales bacterium]